MVIFSFFQQRVGRKIILGYLLICVLMLGIGLMALQRVVEINQRVAQVADKLSVEMSLAKDIAAKTLLARVYADAYASGQDQEELNKFIKNFKELEELIRQLEGLATEQRRVALLRDIKKSLADYKIAFQEVVKLTRHRRDVVLNLLNTNKFLIENKLSAIRISVSRFGDVNVFLSFGNAQSAYLQMQINTSQYLQNGDERYAVLFDRALSEAQAAFSNLALVLKRPADQKSAQEAGRAVAVYGGGFSSVLEDSRGLKVLLNTTFEHLEPQIAGAVAEIVGAIERQYKNYNHESQALLDRTRSELILLLALAVAASIFISLIISRRITGPLSQVMSASQQIANEDLRLLSEELTSLSGGDLRLDLKISAKPLRIDLQDEVGLMAGAFDSISYRLQEAEKSFADMASYLQRMAETARAIARGDLGIRLGEISEHDELGRAIALMLESLRRSAREIDTYQHHLMELVARRTAELEESRRSLFTLMSNLPGLAYRCRNDSRWTMEFVSDGIGPLTGYKPEDLVNNRNIAYEQIIHPEDRKEVRESIEFALREGRAFTVLYRIKTKDGLEKWVWEKGQGVFGPDGGPEALEGFITDITERKHAEEEKERLIQELKKALKQVKTLSGLLPICASCKKIRDDQGYWQQIEGYFHEHSGVDFSHGLCPECCKILYPDIDLTSGT